MKKTIFALLLGASILTAGSNTSNDIITVWWKAFKTFEKIGVDGKFTDVVFTPKANKAKTLDELLLGSKISIDSSKIDTSNIGRNKKVSTLFFGSLKGKTIEGEIVKATAKTPNSGSIEVKIKMNKQDVVVPMSYNFDSKHGELVASGVVDIFDFGGHDALKKINTECFTLHEGKTWNDVDIEFRIKIKGYAVKGVKGLFS
jgi:hypothetical protein